jgi:hypothetical protein
VKQDEHRQDCCKTVLSGDSPLWMQTLELLTLWFPHGNHKVLAMARVAARCYEYVILASPNFLK